jgi:hypothetical protein
MQITSDGISCGRWHTVGRYLIKNGVFKAVFGEGEKMNAATEFM